MSDTILIRVDSSLIPVLEEIKRDSATKIQKMFRLTETPELYGTFASKVLASFYTGKKSEFKIKLRRVSKSNYSIVEVLP